MLIQVNNLTKFYAGKKIFSNLKFALPSKKKIGLIGKNGTGKTTLLRIISGLDTDYEGEAIRSSKCRIGYLSQEASLNQNQTLFEECESHFVEILKLKKQITQMEHDISESPNDLELQHKYGDVLHDFEEKGGYQIENKIEQVLTGLGFSKADRERQISTFSGGEQRRGLLGKLLLSEATLLILDEPTNHLDIFSIKWLESFLKEYNGALLIVAHDRNFMNNLVGEILELERGTLARYSGNYNYYLNEKELRFETQQKSHGLQQDKIKKEEEFIRKNIAGQKTKQAQSRRKALAKIDVIENPSKSRGIKIKIPPSGSTQKNIIEVKNFSKSFGNTQIIKNIDLNMYKGDKVGLIGKNGCGKSTLIKALLDTEATDSSIKANRDIKWTYFAQGNQHLDENQTVFDTISNHSPKLTIQDIRDYLALLQFRGNSIDKVVKQLSGGEKTRLSLLQSILHPTDFFILDEPTNHLDIQTREALADSLVQYNGTALVVSHDRNFLDRFCNRILLISKGKGFIFEGNYSENESKIIQTIKGEVNDSTPVVKQQAKKEIQEEVPKEKKKNVNVFKIQKLEKEIARLETEIESLKEKLHDEKLYNDYQEYQKVENNLKKSEKLLDETYKLWEELH